MFKELNEFIKMTEIDKSIHTTRSYSINLEKFMKALDVSELNDFCDLKIDIIRSHFLSQKSSGLKESSVNAEIRVIKAFDNWLVQNGYSKKNVLTGIKLLKEPKTIAIILTKEEMNAMIVYCKNIKMRLMIALMLYTGIRREEIVNVKLEDFKDGKLTIHGKGRKERILAIHPYVLSLMDKYLKHRKNDYEYLFGTQQGFAGIGAGTWHKLSVDAVRHSVKRAAELAGIKPEKIEKLNPHSLRRSFACRLAENNVGSFAIQKALGHSSIITTERYLAPANASISDGALLAQESPE
jgi:site-specific recombinase XerD